MKKGNPNCPPPNERSGESRCDIDIKFHTRLRIVHSQLMTFAMDLIKQYADITDTLNISEITEEFIHFVKKEGDFLDQLNGRIFF